MTERHCKAGIIGLGFIGAGDQVSGDVLGQQVSALDGTHLEALSGNGRIDVVAGSSRDEGRRQRFAARTGVRVWSDWRVMLREQELDVVSVATYTPSHAEIVLACAERGVRAIYCEKPIATKLVDAERMIAACQGSGSLLVINHNRHFNPNYHRLKHLIADGGLGVLASLSVQWGMGRLANVGTHLFSALFLLTGRPRAVCGVLDPTGHPDCRGPTFRDPGGWGMMRLDGGLIATVNAPDHAVVPMQISVFGADGRAVTGGDDVQLEFPDGRRDHWPSTRAEVTSMDRAVAEIVTWLDDGGGGSFSCPPERSLEVFEAIVAFHTSHDRGGTWVELPLSGAEREREVLCG